MADFVEDEDNTNQKLSSEEQSAQETVSETQNVAPVMIDFDSPQIITYCPVCTMPPEFCEYGASFDKCSPWILENCPECLSESKLAELMGNATLEDGEKPKKKAPGGGAAPLKKAAVLTTKVVIAKVQRQKRKYVTVVTGLETVPDLKIKDAAKIFGKKFSSGASVGDTPQGGKEITIQGDLSFDLPPLLISEFKIAPTSIFFAEDGKLTPFA